MMLHPEMARQLAAARQRELLDEASRHQQTRTARATRSAGSTTAAPTRPYLVRRVHAILTSH